MSDVLFASAVAQRAGTDAATADRVIAAASELIRDMALNGAGCTLYGVGRFDVVEASAGSRARTLGFSPVQRLQRFFPPAL